MLNNFKISSRKLIFILSLYFGFVLNIAFFKTIYLNFPIVICKFNTMLDNSVFCIVNYSDL